MKAVWLGRSLALGLTVAGQRRTCTGLRLGVCQEPKSL